MSASDNPEPLYTVIIRVPFPRGDFVDPPSVIWDATKDRSLWKILSKSPKNSEVDWNALADKYDVSLSFLLQQAAYLYDRQFSQVRAQLRKVGISKHSVPSPILGTESIGGETMVRTVSGNSQQRPASSLSMQRDSAVTYTEGNTQQPSGRVVAPPISRTSSVNTTQTQSRYKLPSSPRNAKAHLNRRSTSPPSRARQPSTPINTAYPSVSTRPAPLSPTTLVESSSDESSSDSDLPVQSRMLRRPPRRLLHSENGDDDDEDSPTFLPFNTAAQVSATYNPSATAIREDAIRASQGNRKSSDAILQSHTSDSSTSSTAQNHPPSHRDPKHLRDLAGATGPIPGRRTAELARMNPVSKSKNEQKLGRESDGTPSMGSSFSDLDDASVTQSALEEALLSNMQHGGMASKMSTFSQAFRSRYL